MRKVAWTVLRLALTIGLLWYFVQVYVDPRTFLAIVERISIPLLLAYLATVFASRWMQAVQTRHALAEAGVAVSSIEVLRSQLIASYYTMFVPGDLVGGGVTWYLLKEARGGGAMIATILIYLRLAFLVTAVPFAVAGMLMESRLHSMALLGPEGVNQVSRITPVTLDLRQIFIEAPVAKELGLHDGQVVHAVAALHKDELKLAISIANGVVHKFNLISATG